MRTTMNSKYSSFDRPARAARLLLKGARVIDPAQKIDQTLDLYIEDGVLRECPNAPPPETDVINLAGHWITPGWFDLHVHLREPGREVAETIASGCQAAMNGGFTGLACMPNTEPPLDDAGQVQWVLDRASQLPVDVRVIAAATRGREGKELVEMSELFDLGVRAFTDDGAPIRNTAVLRHAMEYAHMLGARVFQHAEDLDLAADGAMNEGEWSTRLGLPGVPPVSEGIDVMRCIMLSEYTQSAVHICHVSTRKAVELIREAKRNGLPVTAEVCPHHLLLTDAACKDFDTDFKMSPPLRGEDDRQACVEGLADGTLDAFCTDHAPHTWEAKMQEFDTAPNGVVGLEVALGLALTHLIPKHMEIHAFLGRVVYGPRKILSEAAPRVAVGESANLTIIDPAARWTVEPGLFRSKSRNTPFKGWELTGRAKGIVNRGFAVLS